MMKFTLRIALICLLLAAEFAGVHKANLNASGQGFTAYTYMAGPRRTFALGKREKGKTSIFVQTLLGGVHATEGQYPSGTVMKNSANALAFSAGGGVQVKLKRGLWLRPVQADYLYTRLPNNYSNYQSSFRVGAGVVFDLKGRL